MNDKDNTVTSIDAEQTFDKIQHTFTTKILIQLGTEVMYSQHNKGQVWKAYS